MGFADIIDNWWEKGFTERSMRPIITAHRGQSAHAPENTMAAFERAIREGADACECDVRVTADGEVVLMHDANVARTTDGVGEVAQMTRQEIAALDAGRWKSDEYAGEAPPLLCEVLELHKGRAMLCVELKDYTCGEHVLRIIDTCGADEWASLCSFDYTACVEARRHNPLVPVAWITSPRPGEMTAQDVVRRLLAGNLQAVSTTVHFLSEELLVLCRKAGLGVWIWTVDEPASIVRLARLGVDMIISNDPALAIDACRNAGGGRGL